MAMDKEPRVTEMVQISDCFEAVTVFRRWQTGLFVVTIISLLCLQAMFWITDLSIIIRSNQSSSQSMDQSGVGLLALIQDGLARLTYANLAWFFSLCNILAFFGSTLYLLCIAATLGISIVGRLGGLKHISKAFFLSLVVVVLLVPWQEVLGSMVVGAMFSPYEILQTFSSGTASAYVRYLRFNLYPLALLVLLAIAQWRSHRWTKVVLQRLEIL